MNGFRSCKRAAGRIRGFSPFLSSCLHTFLHPQLSSTPWTVEASGQGSRGCKKMAKMLDGPVPDGARSVSWPWYHHVLTNELTRDAKKLLTTYSGVSEKEMEAHIYSIVRLSSISTSDISLTALTSETKRGGSSHGLVWGNFGS